MKARSHRLGIVLCLAASTALGVVTAGCSERDSGRRTDGGGVDAGSGGGDCTGACTTGASCTIDPPPGSAAPSILCYCTDSAWCCGSDADYPECLCPATEPEGGAACDEVPGRGACTYADGECSCEATGGGTRWVCTSDLLDGGGADGGGADGGVSDGGATDAGGTDAGNADAGGADAGGGASLSTCHPGGSDTCGGALSCFECPGGGPVPSSGWPGYCSTACTSDADCTDPARPRCEHSGDGAAGFCADDSVGCCWLCR